LNECDSFSNLEVLKWNFKNDLLDLLYEIIGKFYVEGVMCFFKEKGYYFVKSCNNESKDDEKFGENVRLLLSYLFYGIISQFNVTFAAELKPITLRDIKNTIGFLVKQLCKIGTFNN